MSTAQRIGVRLVASSPGLLQPLCARLSTSPVLSRLAKGTFWSIAGAVSSRSLGLLSSIILARILGRTTFGELGTIQSTVGLFGTLAGLGLGITATKYVAELRERDKPRCGRVIGLSISTGLIGGVAAGLVLVLFATTLATRTLAAPNLAEALRWGAGLVVLTTLQGTYLGALAGFEAFRQSAWVNLGTGVLGIPLVILGGIFGGLEGVVVGLALQAATACVLCHVALRRRLAAAQVKLSFAVDLTEWKLLWHFALPAFLSGMLMTPAGWFSRTLLVNQHGGYSEMAIVSASNQWMNLLTFVPSMIGAVLVPILANLYAQGRQDQFKRLVRYNLLLNAGISALICLPIVLAAPLILELYGPGFREGVPIFWIAMLGGVCITLNNLLSRCLQSAGRAWTDFTCNSVWALVVVLAGWELVRSYRGVGLVIAHAFAAVALGIWQWFLVRRLFASNALPALLIAPEDSRLS